VAVRFGGRVVPESGRQFAERRGCSDVSKARLTCPREGLSESVGRTPRLGSDSLSLVDNPTVSLPKRDVG